jgi:hypothetical protein
VTLQGQIASSDTQLAAKVRHTRPSPALTPSAVCGRCIGGLWAVPGRGLLVVLPVHHTVAHAIHTMSDRRLAVRHSPTTANSWRPLCRQTWPAAASSAPPTPRLPQPAPKYMLGNPWYHVVGR